MKKLLLLLAATALLSGCTSIQKQLGEAVALAGSVGDVEYERNGFWSDSELTIHVEEDNTRTVAYAVRAKVPGGPSVSIKVANIPSQSDE